jgi:hypothetical protein
MEDTISLIGAVVPGDSNPTGELTTEAALSEEIGQLWSVHIQTKTTIDRTKEELQTIRLDLGARLHEMKKLLSTPGRNGRWSSWLQERQIPRATADRLVMRHQRSLHPDANRLNEAFEPSEQEVMRLFNSILPKLRRTLRTPQSLYRFVDLLASACAGSCFQIREDAILIPKPAAESTDYLQRDDGPQ